MSKTPSPFDDFFEIQTRTGWGQTLAGFAEWIGPQPGWRALDVGCGPGLFPALLAARGCRAVGVDIDPGVLRPAALHPGLAQAAALWLPFSAGQFDLVTASNLLFLLPDPSAALAEMRRGLRPGGQVAVLNPSEYLTVQAAQELAERRGLDGIACESLLSWAARAERHYRWSPADLAGLFAAAGLRLVETRLLVGPGLARLARGVEYPYEHDRPAG